jgi:uncharacterized C2H2 Zn-finger protein
MFNCSLCNKEFKYESELNRHKNRKTGCNKNDDDFNCQICNSNFKYECDYLRHTETKKHIKNYNKSINVDNNINCIKKDLDLNEFKNKINTLENKIDELKKIVIDLKNTIL